MSTIYVAMEDGLLVASGGDGDWTAVEATDALAAGAAAAADAGGDGGTGRLECVAATGDRAFVGTFEAGLLRSVDGGESWERTGADAIDSDAVMSLAVDPHDPEVLWAGTEPSAVYRSPDGGDRWEAVGDVTAVDSADQWFFPPRPHTHHVRWIEPDPADAERVYVGIEAGAFLVSDDRGATWRERPPGSRRDNHTLATHPDAPGRVYAAAGDGYAESTDGGASWSHPQEGLDHRYVWGLAPDPGEPDTVLVSAASGARTAHSPPGDAHLYRRETAGTADGAWTSLDDNGLPTGDGALRAVLTRGTAPGELYAANNRGVYRTTDAGDAWDRLPVDWPGRFERMTCRGLAVV